MKQIYSKNIYVGGDVYGNTVSWTWCRDILVDVRHLFHPLEACEKDTASGTRGQRRHGGFIRTQYHSVNWRHPILFVDRQTLWLRLCLRWTVHTIRCQRSMVRSMEM